MEENDKGEKEMTTEERKKAALDDFNSVGVGTVFVLTDATINTIRELLQPTPQNREADMPDLQAAIKKLEIIKLVMKEASEDMRPPSPHWHNDFLSVAIQRIEEVQGLLK